MNVSPTENRVRSTGGGFGAVFSTLTGPMAELNLFLRQQLLSFEAEIRSMAEYAIESSGKRIRPALIFLSGSREIDVVSVDLVKAASIVEMVHLATLVHDDIMDDADVRRNRRTAARVYGSTAAVLLGDALFAHALHLATEFPTTEVCAAVSESTRRVCSGEIVQTLRRGSTNISVADYYRIIDLKTAELFRVSCFLGAKLGAYDGAFVAAAGKFGQALGVAYQLYDDLADYFGNAAKIGKTLGTDLASGKLTLPLIMLLERLPPLDREEVVEEILGKRPPDIVRRLEQMRDRGIYSAMVYEIDKRLDEAGASFAFCPDELPAQRLLGLSDVLREQVASLRPA